MRHGNIKQIDSGHRGGEGNNGGKKGKRLDKSTCVNDPWTCTTVWGGPVGTAVGWAEEGKGGKQP